MGGRRAARATALSLLLASAVTTQAGRADTTQTLTGTVTDDGIDHVFVDFEVPAGTAEVEVAHDDLSDTDILDFGLYDQAGFRGWGGGNSEPIVVAEAAASRSYLAGPIAAGTWRVVIGKAKLDGGSADYSLTVTTRDVATLAPQPERAPYVDPGAIVEETRWYAGDFHVHSRESGDAAPTIDAILDLATSRHLDFVELSDHNTTSQLDFMNDAQTRAGTILILPGVEFTTYDGHANGIGATAFVDHKIGQPSVTIEAAADAYHDMGALFAINHPRFDLGEACIGCAWAHELDPSKIDAIEIATAGSAAIFLQPTLDYWESLAAAGHRLSAIGGSDDHKAGVDEGAFNTPLGSPTTMVFADALSVAGIQAGVKAGRTVVKVRGPEDPMVEIARSSDELSGEVVLSAGVSGASATMQGRWVVDGEPQAFVALPDGEATLEARVLPSLTSEGGAVRRARFEVWEGTTGVTFTSFEWIAPVEELPQADSGGTHAAGGGCDVSAKSGAAGSGALAFAAMLFSGLVRRRRAQMRGR